MTVLKTKQIFLFKKNKNLKLFFFSREKNIYLQQIINKKIYTNNEKNNTFNQPICIGHDECKC